MSRVWNKEQLDVFEDFATGSGNVAVNAVPGGGKSTTAIESLNHLPQKCGDVLVTSFGTQSVDDLKSKNEHWFVDIRTLNSLGNRAVTEAFGKQVISRERVYYVLDEVLGERPDDPAKRSSFSGFRVRIKALVDFAKCELVSGRDNLMALAEDKEIDTLPPDWMRDRLSQIYGCPWEDSMGEITHRVLEACKNVDGRIDYNDQLWLPIVHNLSVQQFDRIIVDEAQDLSAVQIDLIARSAAKGSRVFAYGQNFQAIYAWRGAGLGMEPLIKKLNMREMSLPVSYRCPKSVVREACAVYPGMRAHPGAIDGYVGSIDHDMLTQKLVAGDVVLSRKNAPLIALFMRCLRDGIPVGMQGREIGNSFIRFIDDSGARTPDELIKYTDEWATTEIARRRKKNPNVNVDKVTDHQECIEALCADTTRLDVVRNRVSQILLAPAQDKVLLSSVHRAKGLQWPRVYVLESSFPVKPSYWTNYASQTKGDAEKWCKKMAAKVMENETEERNILYVAVTRSQRELIYVR
jgi:hypothetical protein